jgi:hypothetical protein
VSRFEPVWLPEDRRVGDRASMTMLKHYALCQRSGYLYQLFKGEASTPAMQRGKAGHLAVERAIRAAVEQGEPMIPGDLVKVIANEVLHEVPVPFEEHDRIREGVWRWSTETAVDPSAVVALETLFVLDVDGFEVRCRIDFAELLEDGAVCAVRDWKFALGGVPGFEEIARRRADGTLAAKQMQLILYALVLAFGVPVREEECDACMGLGDVPAVRWRGETEPLPPGEVTMAGDPRHPCAACAGKSRVEIREPFPVATRAQRFDLELVFPLIEDRDGKMVRRPVTLTRLELEEYRESLRALVAQLRRSEETGDWPAMVSDEACSICPSRPSCPIPAELRDYRGSINTVEEFAETMARLEREEAEMRARKKEAREFVKAHGGAVRFDGKVAELVYSESETIPDRDAMFDAVERARLYGEPFDRGDFVRSRGSNAFKTRDVTEDEREEAESVAGD